MYDREVDDALAYLAPLARVIARGVEYRLGLQFGELYTQALIGAWQAIQEYDAERSDSLWGYSGRFIKLRVYDQVRDEFGRRGDMYSQTGMPVDDEVFRFIGVVESGYHEVEDHELAVAILSVLCPRHRELLRALYLNNYTMAQIGARVNVTESGVSLAAKEARRRARALSGRTTSQYFDLFEVSGCDSWSTSVCDVHGLAPLPDD